MDSRSNRNLIILRSLAIVLCFALSVLLAQAADMRVRSAEELAQALLYADDGDTIMLLADITLHGELPPVTSQITFDGRGYVISGDDRYRIFLVEESGDLTIQNATLTRGKADDDESLCIEGQSWSSYAGGAICNRGTLSVRDSVFSDNSARRFGGAIANLESGEATINSSRFYGNSSDWGAGGAILNFEGGAGSVGGSSFTKNSSYSGGAIANGGVLSISGSSFDRNSSGRGGGAISSWGALTISDSSFYLNSADSRGGVIAT